MSAVPETTRVSLEAFQLDSGVSTAALTYGIVLAILVSCLLRSVSTAFVACAWIVGRED